MKRTTSLVTISLPPEMVKESERVAMDKNMTRSELLRSALRLYLEEANKRPLLKKNLYLLGREDKNLWRKIEKSFRQTRTVLMKERYPYLYE